MLPLTHAPSSLALSSLLPQTSNIFTSCGTNNGAGHRNPGQNLRVGKCCWCPGVTGRFPEQRSWHPQHLAVARTALHGTSTEPLALSLMLSSESHGLVNRLCLTLMSTFQVTYLPATRHHFIKPCFYFTPISSARPRSPTLPIPTFPLKTFWNPKYSHQSLLHASSEKILPSLSEDRSHQGTGGDT